MGAAREPVFRGKRRRRDNRELEIRVREIDRGERGRRGQVFFNQLTAQKIDHDLFLFGELGCDSKPVGEHVTKSIGHFLGKIQRRRTCVDENGRAFVDKPRRLLRDDDFFVRVHRRFLDVRFARGLLHFTYRHSAAADTNNFTFFF